MRNVIFELPFVAGVVWKSVFSEHLQSVFEVALVNLPILIFDETIFTLEVPVFEGSFVVELFIDKLTPSLVSVIEEQTYEFSFLSDFELFLAQTTSCIFSPLTIVVSLGILIDSFPVRFSFLNLSLVEAIGFD